MCIRDSTNAGANADACDTINCADELVLVLVLVLMLLVTMLVLMLLVLLIVLVLLIMLNCPAAASAGGAIISTGAGWCWYSASTASTDGSAIRWLFSLG